MRIPHNASTGRSPVNMTPMIDVVFLLIVFFTATNTMVRSEYSHEVDLPVASQGKDREQNPDIKKITANILPTEEIYVTGKRVTTEQFQEILRAELAQYPAERIEVQLRADQKTPFGAVQPLLLGCARSGIWQVSFSVQERED